MVGWWLHDQGTDVQIKFRARRPGAGGGFQCHPVDHAARPAIRAAPGSVIVLDGNVQMTGRVAHDGVNDIFPDIHEAVVVLI